MLDRHTGLEENRTPNGKQIGCHKINGTSLYGLSWRDGGELPDELKGHRFTSSLEAQKAIRAYLTAFWDIHDEAVEKQEKARNKRSENAAASTS